MTTDNIPAPITCRRIFPGLPNQVRAVRCFLREHLGDHPCTGDAEMVISELATNAVEHTRSAGPAGEFTVQITTRPDDTVRIEVTDQGGPECFDIPSKTGAHEGGRGLIVVTGLTKEWGVTGTPAGRTVWAEVLPDW